MGAQWMNLSDISARIDRLDKLSRGLADEQRLWRDRCGPLFFWERREYLEPLHRAKLELVNARTALANARLRLPNGGESVRRQDGLRKQKGLAANGDLE